MAGFKSGFSCGGIHPFHEGDEVEEGGAAGLVNADEQDFL